jgi:hypothetical protein
MARFVKFTAQEVQGISGDVYVNADLVQFIHKGGGNASTVIVFFRGDSVSRAAGRVTELGASTAIAGERST